MFYLHRLWILVCSFRLHFWLNRFPQTSQRYGFSPVWILLCLSRCPERSKYLPQYGQKNPFLNISLLTDVLQAAAFRCWLKLSRPRLNGFGGNPPEPPQDTSRLLPKEDSGGHGKAKWSELLHPASCLQGPPSCRNPPVSLSGSLLLSSPPPSMGSLFTWTWGAGKEL